jgi:glycosyltransferase involved in cell wall biosynthesis
MRAQLQSNPNVSVIIPVYNGEKTLEYAVQSVLAQTLKNIEILIIDDGSADSTWTIISKLSHNHDNIQMLKHEKNKGVSAARNTGLDAARGTWIALLDADDTYDIQRLEKLIQEATERDCDVLADNLLLVESRFEQEKKPRKAFNLDVSHTTHPLSLVELINLDSPNPAEGHKAIGYCKPIIRRSFLNSSKVRYNEEVEVGEDFKLYLDLISSGAKFCLSNQARYRFTVSQNSSLSSKGPAIEKLIRSNLLLISQYGPLEKTVKTSLRRRQNHFKYSVFRNELLEGNFLKAAAALRRIPLNYTIERGFCALSRRMERLFIQN